MNTIWIIFKKEIKELFRDRKSLFMMIGFPILVLPILLAGGIELVKTFGEKEANKKIKIGFLNSEQGEDLIDLISGNEKYQIINNIDPNKIEAFIEADSVDIILEFDQKFAENLKSNSTGLVTLYHKTKGLTGIPISFTNQILNQYEQERLTERLTEKNIEQEMLNPIDIKKQDITSDREKAGKADGGVIPYFLLIYCFIGAMMPAIALGASEKEKGTLETLLASPSSHFKILLGKWWAVFSTSFLSAFAVILGIILAMNIVEMPSGVYMLLSSLLSMKTIMLIMLLISPIAAIFSAIALSISIYAKSFKEAQNYISPMMMIIILPALLGMTLPLELNNTSALIPIYNVVLSCKEIMAGTIDTFLLLEVLISSFILSFIAIFFASKLFKKESFIFRN